MSANDAKHTAAVSKFLPMSAQLLAGIKKKRKELPQSTIDAFFTSKSAQTDTPNTDTDKLTSQQEGGTLEHDLA